MYKLVNKYGNAVVETESAVKRDRLIGQGYRLVEEGETAPAEPKKKGKGKAAAEDDKKE